MSDMENKEILDEVMAENPIPEREPWYVDLNKEEFVAFRMLTWTVPTSAPCC